MTVRNKRLVMVYKAEEEDQDPDRVEGEITVSPSGSVVIGAPAAVAIVTPPPDGEVTN